MGLPSIWVLAAVTVGAGMFGILGMLLSVPAASTMYRLIKNDVAKKDKLARVNDTSTEDTPSTQTE